MMIVRTTISSMSVNPRAVCRQRFMMALPVSELRPVERLAVEGRVDVEDVLPAPTRGVGSVLVRTESPLAASRHGIGRNVAEKFQLASRRIVRGGDAVDERLQIGRIVLAAGLDLERADVAEVGLVLVLVDRGPHLA